MDIKEQIAKIVDRLKEDEDLLEQFKKNPVKAVEKLIGVDLPDDIIEKIIAGVKGKIAIDDVSDVVDKLKKLF